MDVPRATGFCDVEAAARAAFPPRGGASAWPAAATVHAAQVRVHPQPGSLAAPATVRRAGRDVAEVPPGAPDSEARGPELEQPARERSRGLHRPLRQGAPVRLPRDRGSFPSLSTEAERATAIAELHGDVYAPSSRDSLSFKWPSTDSRRRGRRTPRGTAPTWTQPWRQRGSRREGCAR